MKFFLNDEERYWLYFFYSALEFWRSMVMVVLYFSDKGWNKKKRLQNNKLYKNNLAEIGEKEEQKKNILKLGSSKTTN